jgi:hypothetical protein
MSRVVTAAEIKSYQDFAAANHIVVDGEVGEKNANVLAAYLDVQMYGAIVNQENLTKAFNAVRTQLTLIDPREVEYTKIFNSLSQGEQTVFAHWWGAQKRFVTAGLEGAENAAIILKFLKDRRYQVTYEGLDQAVQNIVSNPGRKLHLVEVPTVDFTPGRHSNKSFKEEKDNGEFRPDGRKNHARNPKIVEQSFSPKTIEADFQMKSEALTGKTHGQTQMCRRLFETNKDGSINWRNTYASRCRYLEHNGERTM